MWDTQKKLKQKVYTVNKNTFLCFFCFVFWRRSCELVIFYFLLVLGFWVDVPNWSLLVAKTLNEGVECDWFVISLRESKHEWVCMSSCLLLFLHFQFIITEKVGSDSVLCRTRMRDRQRKPVLLFVLFFVMKEILCTFNGIISIRIWLLNLYTQSGTFGYQDNEWSC